MIGRIRYVRMKRGEGRGEKGRRRSYGNIEELLMKTKRKSGGVKKGGGEEGKEGEEELYGRSKKAPNVAGDRRGKKRTRERERRERKRNR